MTFFEEQARRLYGLGELEGEALEVLRLIVRQTQRGENLDSDLVERAKAVVDRYDKALVRGHEAPGGSATQGPMSHSRRQPPGAASAPAARSIVANN